ncbi:MAG: trimeric intracellular cation channel family protein [Staphylococcus sp.]|nr:trimeric intracellular cation channel family protein [Staphylococcus sp.]
MVESTFIFIIEILGTLAFGVSGVRLAAKKHFDWFGAYTIGVITAIGGGTLRDVLLDIPVFWMQTWLYLAVTGVSFLIVAAFTRVLTSDSKSLFMFDAVGLTLFVITGIEKTLVAGYPMWVAIIMGMITGSFGGILRDVLINEEPLFFRKDIYATACIGGGMMYWVTALCAGPVWLQEALCVITILVLRWGALRYDWHLPEMKERSIHEAIEERRRDHRRRRD